MIDAPASDSFIVAKRCKLQLEDGSMTDCYPNDPVPPTAILQNHALWIKMGYLIHREGRVVPVAPGTFREARAANARDVERSKPSRLPAAKEYISPSEITPFEAPRQMARLAKKDLDVFTRQDILKLAKDCGIKVGDKETREAVIERIIKAQG